MREPAKPIPQIRVLLPKHARRALRVGERAQESTHLRLVFITEITKFLAFAFPLSLPFPLAFPIPIPVAPLPTEIA
jgi:hypothetical protein